MAIILDGTNENRANETQNYLEGMLSLLWRNSPHYSRVVSYLYSKKGNEIKRTYITPTFLNPACPKQMPFTEENVEFFGMFYKRISGVRNITTIPAAIKWFRLAYPNYLITEQWTDAKEFILCWTALEVLCRGKKAATKIKQKFSRHYKISTASVEKRIGIGKLYNARSKILHDGADLAISQHQMEILRETFIVYLGLLLHIECKGLLIDSILEGKAAFIPNVFKFEEKK